jgi:hypothetical protein
VSPRPIVLSVSVGLPRIAQPRRALLCLEAPGAFLRPSQRMPPRFSQRALCDTLVAKQSSQPTRSALALRTRGGRCVGSRSRP